MSEYKNMYLKMFRASEEAANILITAQRECEELYINLPESELRLIPLVAENEMSEEEQ